MKIQQKDNETLAAYICSLKTPARQCGFDNGTTAISIFVKGLRDAPTVPAKIHEKDPQTLAKVIRHVEKLKRSTPTNSHTDTFLSQYDVQQ